MVFINSSYQYIQHIMNPVIMNASPRLHYWSKFKYFIIQIINN